MAFSFTENSATVSTTEINVFTGTTTLTVQTTDQIEQLLIDFNAMASGDVFQIRAYESFNSTVRRVDRWTLRGAQSDPGFIVPSMLLGIGYYITIVKLTGTDRTIRWILASVT